MKQDMLRAPPLPSDRASSLEPIDYADSKIAYVVERCRGKRVLDLGCVMQDAGQYRSRYFLHRAIAEVAEEAIGLDLHEAGVEVLRGMGYRVEVGDAEHFAFDQPFDVIVAGDIVEHLGNLEGFLESCRAALAPGGHDDRPVAQPVVLAQCREGSASR